MNLYFMIRYSYSENSRPIDVEGYCDQDGNYGWNYRRYWNFFGNLPNFIRKYEEAIYGRNSSDSEHCIKNTRQNVAIVHFLIAPSANDLINKIVKTPRVTTADILSNIGMYTTLQINISLQNINYPNM